MAKSPVVVSFDLATATGIAIGAANSAKPSKLMTWNLAAAGKSRAARLLLLFNKLDELFRETQIDVVAFEATLGASVATRIGARDDTINFMSATAAIVEVQAARAGKQLWPFSVQDARRHLLRDRPPKGEGKKAVMRMMKILGVPFQNDNESDAAAGWFYVTAQLNPRIAHLTTPLFRSP